MISWAAVNGADEDEENTGGHVTKEGIEHSLRSLYERAINTMSRSHNTGDENWMTSKMHLTTLLERINEIEDVCKRNRLEYLALKNLSRVKESENNYCGAMEDALSAFDVSPITNDTNLLTRIALLSLKTGDTWTCQTLLYSGCLSDAITSTLQKIDQQLQQTTSQSTSSSSACPLPTIIEYKCVLMLGNLTPSALATYSLPQALLCLISEILRVAAEDPLKLLEGGTIIELDYNSSDSSITAISQWFAEGSQRDLTMSPSLDIRSSRAYPVVDTDAAIYEEAGSSLIPSLSKASSASIDDNSDTQFTHVEEQKMERSTVKGTPQDDENIIQQEGDIEKKENDQTVTKKSRRKSSRQVAKKVQDPQFDYRSTVVSTGVTAASSAAETSVGLWEQMQVAMESHLLEYFIGSENEDKAVPSDANSQEIKLVGAIYPQSGRASNAEELSSVSRLTLIPLSSTSLLQHTSWKQYVQSCICAVDGSSSSVDVSSGPKATPRKDLVHMTSPHSDSKRQTQLLHDLRYCMELGSSAQVVDSQGESCHTDNAPEIQVWEILRESLYSSSAVSSSSGSAVENDSSRKVLSPHNLFVSLLALLSQLVGRLINAKREASYSAPEESSLSGPFVRNVVVLCLLGITSSSCGYNAFALVTSCLTDSESLLIAECCVDLLLHEQHGHHVDSLFHEVLGKRSRENCYRQVLDEFLAACVIEWTSRGVFLPKTNTEAIGVKKEYEKTSRLRMVWVALQYSRLAQSRAADVDAGGHAPGNTTGNASTIRSMCNLYLGICDARDTLYLCHLGAAPPDCDLCVRVVSREVVEGMLPKSLTELGHWAECLCATVKSETTDGISECLKGLSGHVYLPECDALINAESLESERRSPKDYESMFQVGLIDSEDFKSAISNGMDPESASLALADEDLDALCRSKYSLAVYIIVVASTTRKEVLPVVYGVTSMLLVEIVQILSRKAGEDPNHRTASQLKLIAAILHVIANSRSWHSLGCNNELTAPERKLEGLVCQFLLQVYALKETQWHSEQISRDDSYELDISTAVESLCINTMAMIRSSKMFESRKSLALVIALISACESDMVYTVTLKAWATGNGHLISYRPRTLTVLLEYLYRDAANEDELWKRCFSDLSLGLSLYMARNMDFVTRHLKILSEDTAIYSAPPGRLVEQDTPAGQAAPWMFKLADQDPCHVVATVFSSYSMLMSCILSTNVPSSDKPDRLVQWTFSVLTILEGFYSEMSARGYFYVDSGALSRCLLVALSPLLTQTYYPQHSDCMKDVSGSHGAFKGITLPSHVSSLYLSTEESLTLLMTLLGQLSFDVFDFPLCTFYCRNKTDSLKQPPDVRFLPFLLSFIRFCDDDMGVHASASRMAYNFLYLNIPQLKYPAAYFKSVATSEECIMKKLCSVEEVSSFRQRISSIDVAIGSDNDMHRVFTDFYGGLLKCGPLESCFNVQSFPDRPRISASGASDADPSADQTYIAHPFFYHPIDEIKSHAHIHLYLSHLSLSPTDIDMWFKVYDRIHELICLCLDDIGFNVYPTQNVHSSIKLILFSSSNTLGRVLGGTMARQADDIYTEMESIMNNGNIFPTVKDGKIEWWNDCEYPAAVHSSQCNLQNSPNQTTNDIADKGYRQFVSCLDGVLSEYEEDGTERPGATSSLVGVALIFAKLNALLAISDKVVNILHDLLNCNEANVLKATLEVPEEYIDRYRSLCELRCLTFMTMAKMYHAGSNKHTEYTHRSYYYSCAGMDVASLGLTTDDADSKYEKETENSKSGNTATNYFLLFIRGKTLWKLTGRAFPALDYLSQANVAIDRAITVEKIDKRYRALVVCEMHKLRLHKALRDLRQLNLASHNRPCSEIRYFGEDLHHLREEEKGFDYLRSFDVETSKKRALPQLDTATSAEVPSCDRILCPTGEHISHALSVVTCPYCGTVETQRSPEQEVRWLTRILCGLDNDKLGEDKPVYSSEDLRHSHRMNYWGVIVEALRGLRWCKQWDAYDFKSVYLISRFLLGLYGASIHSDLKWAFPPLEIINELKSVCGKSFTQIDRAEGALAEIHTLFAKRRPQVVAMWTHENSPHRFDQLLQRIVVFDNLRAEYISYYWEVLSASRAINKANDIFAVINSTYAKKPFSSVTRWFTRLSTFAFTGMYDALVFEYLTRIEESDETASQYVGEFFSAVESSLSKNRSTIQEPKWMKSLYTFEMRKFIDYLDATSDVFAIVVQNGKEPESGGAKETSNRALEDSSQLESETLIDSNNTIPREIAEDLQAADVIEAITPSVIVQWGMSRGWGSAGASTTSKKGKGGGSGSSSSRGLASYENTDIVNDTLLTDTLTSGTSSHSEVLVDEKQGEEINIEDPPNLALGNVYNIDAFSRRLVSEEVPSTEASHSPSNERKRTRGGADLSVQGSGVVVKKQRGFES